MSLALLAMLAEQLDTDPCQWSTFLGATFSRTFSSHLTALPSSLLDPSSSSAAFFLRFQLRLLLFAATMRAYTLRFSLVAAPRRAWCLLPFASLRLCARVLFDFLFSLRRGARGVFYLSLRCASARVFSSIFSFRCAAARVVPFFCRFHRRGRHSDFISSMALKAAFAMSVGNVSISMLRFSGSIRHVLSSTANVTWILFDLMS